MSNSEANIGLTSSHKNVSHKKVLEMIPGVL